MNTDSQEINTISNEDKKVDSVKKREFTFDKKRRKRIRKMDNSNNNQHAFHETNSSNKNDHTIANINYSSHPSHISCCFYSNCSCFFCMRSSRYFTYRNMIFNNDNQSSIYYHPPKGFRDKDMIVSKDMKYLDNKNVNKNNLNKYDFQHKKNSTSGSQTPNKPIEYQSPIFARHNHQFRNSQNNFNPNYSRYNPYYNPYNSLHHLQHQQQTYPPQSHMNNYLPHHFNYSHRPWLNVPTFKNQTAPYGKGGVRILPLPLVNQQQQHRSSLPPLKHFKGYVKGQQNYRSNSSTATNKGEGDIIRSRKHMGIGGIRGRGSGNKNDGNKGDGGIRTSSTTTTTTSLRNHKNNNCSTRYSLRNRLNLASRKLVQKSQKQASVATNPNKYNGGSCKRRVYQRGGTARILYSGRGALNTASLRRGGGGGGMRNNRNRKGGVVNVKDRYCRSGEEDEVEDNILRKEIAHAPKNDNEFLMQDHYTDAKGVIYTPSNYVHPSIPSASVSVDTSTRIRPDSLGSNDDFLEPHPHHTQQQQHQGDLYNGTGGGGLSAEEYEEELFLEKEFAEEYESVRNQRLNSMTKAQLIQEVLYLEAQLEEREKELMIMKMAEANPYHVKNCQQEDTITEDTNRPISADPLVDETEMED